MMPPRLFDRALLAARRRRAAKSGAPGAGVVEARVAGDLIDRLSFIRREFHDVAVLGSPAPLAALSARKGARSLVHVAEPGGAGTSADQCVVADLEQLPLREATFDLVVSVLSLTTANDLPGALVQIRRALKPDGLLLAAILGGETLTELRQAMLAAESEVTGGASPRVAPFADVRDLGGLMQRAGFALPVADVERLTLTYPDPVGLLRDLREVAATNALTERRRSFLSRRVLARAIEIYRERFSNPDGRVRATLDVIALTAWAPHDSQQKPLQPGSATARFADALGTREQSAGESIPRRPR
jgi:SAM-dependent methyltransferase